MPVKPMAIIAAPSQNSIMRLRSWLTAKFISCGCSVICRVPCIPAWTRGWVSEASRMVSAKPTACRNLRRDFTIPTLALRNGTYAIKMGLSMVILALREPNGRKQRPNVAKLERLEKEFVQNQPHRKGSLDQKRESALGRFVDDHRRAWADNDDAEAAFLAGNKYWALVHRWRSLNDIPESTRLREGEGAELSEDELRKLNQSLKCKINAANSAMRRFNAIGFAVTRSLCLEDKEPHAIHMAVVKIALDALALEFGLV